MPDTRPSAYRYWDQLIQHLGGPDVIFDGKMAWPRQFEIHLPGNHINPCNLHCAHCAGRWFDKSLGAWEITALRLLDKLEGAIPYHIYGGAYTEPTLNPYLMTFLAMTKRYHNYFGVHTNAVCLKALDDAQEWLHELVRLSSSSEDYISFALDGGLPWGWRRTKGAQRGETFWGIIDSIKKVTDVRDKLSRPLAVRVTYLMTEHNSSPETIGAICNIMTECQVSSLRFAIPFAQYNQSFGQVREYKRTVETTNNLKYQERLAPYLSSSKEAKPYICWCGPEFTDIDGFDFDLCSYGYFQITYGADGHCYRCSTSATPTGACCRLGPITDNMERFKSMVLRNQQPTWKTSECFSRGLRCNRMGFEICRAYANYIAGRQGCAPSSSNQP
jgi:hypothetical protein